MSTAEINSNGDINDLNNNDEQVLEMMGFGNIIERHPLVINYSLEYLQLLLDPTTLWEETYLETYLSSLKWKLLHKE